jgi:hypothetical protein
MYNILLLRMHSAVLARPVLATATLDAHPHCHEQKDAQAN